MNREEINNKMDEIYADKIGRMAERCGFIVCSDLLMPEIERAKSEMNLHLAQCMSQQKEIERLKEEVNHQTTAKKTATKNAIDIGKENEQLRAQLAERDKEIERLRNNMRDVIDGKYKLDREFALEAQLSQARETITDFRSALEFYAKDFIDIDTEGNATRYKASAHNSDMAREVLARHPDSTEVKG